MKNILGTTENLTLYNKEGKGIYEFKDSNGRSNEYTYDSKGNLLTYKNSDGYGYERTYDSKGNLLTFKNSNGFSSEWTYDSNGKELTYKNSDGVSRGFDIGAKWQAERSYSKKEVLAMLIIKHDGLSAEYVLEQFKKK